MSIYRYTIWPAHERDRYVNIHKQIGQRKPDRVDFFAPEEWIYEYKRFEGWKHFEEQAIDRELRFIVGSFPNKRLEEHLPTNTKIIYWSTFWIYATYLQIERCETFNISGPITVPFMSLNNKAHPHRCAVMDELVKRGMDKDAYISWHEPNADWHWQHWFPRKLEVDNYGEDPNKHPNSYQWSETFEKVMSNSFMSLITESTMASPFLTEKTFQQIFYKRPFLTFSSAKVYAELDKLGFKRYDEVFDYSFDDVEDDIQRGKMIIDEVEKIIGQDYKVLTKKLRPKLEYNCKRALEIVADKSYIPDEVKLQVREYPDFQGFYTQICNLVPWQLRKDD